MTAPWEPITRIQDLRAGDIGLGPIGGLVGLGVGFGQWALGEGWSLDVDEDEVIKIRHAAIITKPAVTTANGFAVSPPILVEAMPRGARRRPALEETVWTKDWAWVRIPEDYVGQARDAAYVADQMAERDTPYSPLSYAALSSWRLTDWASFRATGTKTPLGEDRVPGLHSPLEKWINRRVPGTATWLPSGGKMRTDLPAEAICSVLVDQSWTLTGKRVMAGVPHQCVTPAALARRLRYNTPGAVWSFPGR